MELLKIAVRNVLRNRRRSLLSLSGVFLGVGVVVGVTGFMNGIQRSIVENTVETTLGAVQVHKEGFLRSLDAAPLLLDMADDPALMEKIRGLPGVIGVSTRINFPIMVNKEEETVFAFATAVDPKNEEVTCPASVTMITGGEPLDARPGLLMSESLADTLGAKIGDLITLLGNDRDGALNGIEIPLRGFYLGKLPGLENTIRVTLPEAQQLLRMEGRYTEIAIGITSVDHTDAVLAAVRSSIPEGLEVHDWRELVPNLVSMMEFQGVIILVASLLFIVVALTIIVNTMLMTVLERVREIGSVLALGLKQRRVVGLCLMEAAMLGLAGGVAGAIVGYGVVQWLGARGVHVGAPGVEADNVVRPYIAIELVLLACVLAAVGAALAALWPALRASRLRPVEALRHV